MRVNDWLSGAVGARSISLQDVFNSGGDLSSVGFSGRHAGIRVNTVSAAQLTAVYGSWRIISEAIATLPRDMVVQGPDGLPVVAEDARPVWLDNPSEFETWSEFLGQVVLSILQTGNAYVLLDWGAATGNLTQMKVLDPLHSERVSREVVKVSGTAGVQTLPVFIPGRVGVSSVEILHIRGMTSPGSLEALSPIAACAESMGVSLGAQRYGAKFFESDATPGGVLEVPAEVKLSDAGRQATREAWSDMFGGVDRARRVAILTEGMRYRPLQISPSESQFIEQRRFTVEEVARVYGVPAHLLMQNDGTSGWGTAMAEANTAFVTNTLRPHLVRLEEVFSSLARRELGRGPSVSIALHEEALMRGATSDRWEMLRKNVNSGVVTADEARMAEGMPPLPDGIGAVPWVPLQQLPQSHVVDPAISEKDVV